MPCQVCCKLQLLTSTEAKAGLCIKKYDLENRLGSKKKKIGSKSYCVTVLFLNIVFSIAIAK